MRLIDADSIVISHFILATDTIKMMDAIDEAPTIEIVRCKECKHYNEEMILNCRRHISQVKPDDFCSYGVKQTERSE